MGTGTPISGFILGFVKPILGVGSQFWALGANFKLHEPILGVGKPNGALEANFWLWEPILGFGQFLGFGGQFGLWEQVLCFGSQFWALGRFK